MTIQVKIIGGYYVPGKTPQLVQVVNDLMAVGWQPVSSPLMSDVSGWVSQMMMLTPGAPTAYTVTTGYDNSGGRQTPLLSDNVPVDGWFLLGDLQWLSSHFYLQAWVNGKPYSPDLPLDIRDPSQVTGLPLVLSNAGDITGTLPVANGGTGGTIAAAARTNLEAKYRRASSLGAANNLNDLKGPQDGFYLCASTAFATPANNYPVAAAGALLVMQNAANGVDGCTQIYWPYNDNVSYTRYYDASAALTWTPWLGNYQFNKLVEARAGVLMRTNTTGGTSPSLTAQVYDAAGTTLMGQGEFRADSNGSLSIINRTSGSPQFLTLASNGDLTIPGQLNASKNVNIRGAGTLLNIESNGEVIRLHPASASQALYIMGYDIDNVTRNFLIGRSGSNLNVMFARYNATNQATYSAIILEDATQDVILRAWPPTGTLKDFRVRASTGDVVLTGNLEIGNNSAGAGAGNSICDFHSSSLGGDYDARIRVDGGSATSGQGLLSITASKISSIMGGTTRSMTSIPSTYSGICTVDANGFVKAASPIIDLRGDGTFTANEEAAGVTVERLAVGHYKLTGTLGLNADPTWWISIPQDVNGQSLIWVDYTIDVSGDIEVFTYHRVHPDSPAFARNIIDGVQNGDPIDIPSGKYVSLRVNVPT